MVIHAVTTATGDDTLLTAGMHLFFRNQTRETPACRQAGRALQFKKKT